MTMRSDWKAIRAVYHLYGHLAARAWAETPLIDTIDVARNVVGNYHEAGSHNGINHCPLMPVVVRIPEKDGGAYSVRISKTTWVFVPGDKTVTNDESLTQPNDGDEVFRMDPVFEWDKEDLGKAGMMPPGFLHPDGSCFMFLRSTKTLDEETDISDDCCRMVLEILDEIDRSESRPVEMIDTNSRSAMIPKHDKKPWTRGDLRNVILMDLSEARKYGHRIDHGGSHASPIPHTRRGHYATLRHPKWKRAEDGTARRVWVKPTWVGDTEWIFEGRQYRVIGADAAVGCQ